MSCKRATPLKAVDFFCGAGGMSFGLQEAGIKILGGIDNDSECQRTYEHNIQGATYIKHDISTLTPKSLEKRLGLCVADPSLVFAGCSPCQFWSKIRTDKSKSIHTAFLLRRFQRFIRYFLPGFVIIENVPGLLSRKDETPLPRFINFLIRLGYSCDDGIINANHYGVPQNRKRYLLVATRLSYKISLPPPNPDPLLVVSSFIGVANGFQQVDAGHQDHTDFRHTSSSLSPENLQRIRLTPKSGGGRTVWKDNATLQIGAYRGKDHHFRDVYGRMYWNRPAPTITTRFNSFSNGRFGHPEEDRAITIREGATLQTFPKHYVFYGTNINTLARQIGNAVPPELARRIGEHIIEIVSNG